MVGCLIYVGGAVENSERGGGVVTREHIGRILGDSDVGNNNNNIGN